MFLVAVTDGDGRHAGPWRTVGSGRGCPAGRRMATSGLLTSWLAELTGTPVAELAAARRGCRRAPRGCGAAVLRRGAQPAVRSRCAGVLLGLELRHTAGAPDAGGVRVGGVRGAAQPGGVRRGRRHGRDWRLVAVGGGTTAGCGRRSVSDVTGRPQEVPAQTIAPATVTRCLAATAPAWYAGHPLGRPGHRWYPIPRCANRYDTGYAVYRDLYRRPG